MADAPVLVTGATGFVGTALVDEMARRGLACRPLSREPRPGHLALGQLTGATDWREALAGCGAVVHLAARVHRMAGADDEAAYRADNVDVTLNLARQAAAAGVRRLVFLSSIKVNGEATSPGRPFTEADPPAPADAYARSKLEAEDGLRRLGAATGLEVVVIRPPLVYGPGVRANLLTLMRWMDRGWPLPFGAIRNRRSLVGVRNLTDLILACLEHPAAAGETFLAADGEPVSTTTLLRAMAAALGRPARLLPVPPTLLAAGLRLAGRGGMAARLLGSLEVDAGKARRLLGWIAPFTFEAGLAETAAACRAAPGTGVDFSPPRA